MIDRKRVGAHANRPDLLRGVSPRPTTIRSIDAPTVGEDPRGPNPAVDHSVGAWQSPFDLPRPCADRVDGSDLGRFGSMDLRAAAIVALDLATAANGLATLTDALRQREQSDLTAVAILLRQHSGRSVEALERLGEVARG